MSKTHWNATLGTFLILQLTLSSLNRDHCNEVVACLRASVKLALIPTQTSHGGRKNCHTAFSNCRLLHFSSDPETGIIHKKCNSMADDASGFLRSRVIRGHDTYHIGKTDLCCLPTSTTTVIRTKVNSSWERVKLFFINFISCNVGVTVIQKYAYKEDSLCFIAVLLIESSIKGIMTDESWFARSLFLLAFSLQPLLKHTGNIGYKTLCQGYFLMFYSVQ